MLARIELGVLTRFKRLVEGKKYIMAGEGFHKNPVAIEKMAKSLDKLHRSYVKNKNKLSQDVVSGTRLRRDIVDMRVEVELLKTGLTCRPHQTISDAKNGWYGILDVDTCKSDLFDRPEGYMLLTLLASKYWADSNYLPAAACYYEASKFVTRFSRIQSESIKEFLLKNRELFLNELFQKTVSAGFGTPGYESIVEMLINLYAKDPDVLFYLQNYARFRFSTLDNTLEDIIKSRNSEPLGCYNFVLTRVNPKSMTLLMNILVIVNKELSKKSVKDDFYKQLETIQGSLTCMLDQNEGEISMKEKNDSSLTKQDEITILRTEFDDQVKLLKASIRLPQFIKDTIQPALRKKHEKLREKLYLDNMSELNNEIMKVRAMADACLTSNFYRLDHAIRCSNQGVYFFYAIDFLYKNPFFQTREGYDFLVEMAALYVADGGDIFPAVDCMYHAQKIARTYSFQVEESFASFVFTHKDRIMDSLRTEEQWSLEQNQPIYKCPHEAVSIEKMLISVFPSDSEEYLYLSTKRPLTPPGSFDEWKPRNMPQSTNIAAGFFSTRENGSNHHEPAAMAKP